MDYNKPVRASLSQGELQSFLRRRGWGLAVAFAVALLGLFSIPLMSFTDLPPLGDTESLVLFASPVGAALLIAWWVTRCPACGVNTGELVAACCLSCGVKLRASGSGHRKQLLSRITRLDATALAGHRGSARIFQFKGFLIFCIGPLLYLLDTRLIAAGRTAPQLLFVPLAAAAMFVGGLMMLMGTESCVVCDRRQWFFPGGRIGNDWVCADCLLPYEKPVVIRVCPYCAGPWEIHSRYERLLATRSYEASRCPHCSAPAEPIHLKKYLD